MDIWKNLGGFGHLTLNPLRGFGIDGYGISVLNIASECSPVEVGALAHLPPGGVLLPTDVSVPECLAGHLLVRPIPCKDLQDGASRAMNHFVGSQEHICIIYCAGYSRMACSSGSTDGVCVAWACIIDSGK